MKSVVVGGSVSCSVDVLWVSFFVSLTLGVKIKCSYLDFASKICVEGWGKGGHKLMERRIGISM